MVVVSSQEHWAHFLLMLHPLTSDLMESKQECHVIVGGRSVNFYHAMLAEKAEGTKEKNERKGEAGYPNGVHSFLLLIQGGCYSGQERSLMRVLVNHFGVEAVGRLAVVSLDDSEVGWTPDHDLQELLDACQGRFCRMTMSTAQDGLDVLLHLLHVMPAEQNHLTQGRRSSKSSSSGGGSGGGEDMKTQRHQDLQAEKEEEQRFVLRVEQQERKRAMELQQLMAKHTEERRQEEEEKRCLWMKRKAMKEEVARRSHRARLQQQLSITPGIRTSAAAAGGCGDGPATAGGGGGGGGWPAAAAGRARCC